MEVETAVRRHLLADATVNGWVDGRVYRHRLEEKVDGTGRAALVVLRNNGWATPDPIGSEEFPIVRVECWADPDRTATGEVARANGVDKAWALARSVQHRMTWRVRGEWMGAVGSNPGLLVLAVARRNEGFVVTREDAHATGGRTLVESMGESVKVVVEYNLSVIH